MPLQFAARPNCLARQTYGIYVCRPSGVRRSPHYRIQFRLAGDISGMDRFQLSLPVGTPEHRALGVRDTLLKAIQAGHINNHAEWGRRCRHILNIVRQYNRRDGIKPPAPWSIKKAKP